MDKYNSMAKYLFDLFLASNPNNEAINTYAIMLNNMSDDAIEVMYKEKMRTL